ncbi:unnamed protein product [Malus baccata var. baccata]
MNLFDNPHFFPLQILRLLSLLLFFFTLGFIWRSHQTSIFVPPDFFNKKLADVVLGFVFVEPYVVRSLVFGSLFLLNLWISSVWLCFDRCSWPDVTIGEASVSWWRGFVLVGMLGGGCCSRSLGFLLLYFMAWAFIVYWIYWASFAGSLLG